jgi:CxxC motif-containing protein
MKWSDKELVLETVKQNGRSLEYASEEFKNDKEVVLEAVKQDGDLLCHASKELKNNDKKKTFNCCF